MSTATTSSAPDPPAQWTALSDDEITLGNVETLLKPISDDLWVSAACVDRILDDATVQKALLDLGLQRTSAATQRARITAARVGSPSTGDDGEGEERGETAKCEPEGPISRNLLRRSIGRGNI